MCNSELYFKNLAYCLQLNLLMWLLEHSKIDALWHATASAHFESGTPRSVSFGTQYLVTQHLQEQKVILSWVFLLPHGLSLSRPGFPTYIFALIILSPFKVKLI